MLPRRPGVCFFSFCAGFAAGGDGHVLVQRIPPPHLLNLDETVPNQASLRGERIEEHVHTRSVQRARKRASEIDQVLTQGNEVDLHSLRLGDEMTVADRIKEFKENWSGWTEKT